MRQKCSFLGQCAEFYEKFNPFNGQTSSRRAIWSKLVRILSTSLSYSFLVNVEQLFSAVSQEGGEGRQQTQSRDDAIDTKLDQEE